MISGKAVITVRHTGGDYRDVEVFMQSCSSKSEDGGQLAYEMLQLDGETVLPNKADLEWGDVWTMKANYEVHFIQGDGWTTDDDVDVYFDKVRVLRKHQAKENKPENLLLVKTLKQKVIDFCLVFPGHSGVKKLLSCAETTKLPWSNVDNVMLIRSMVPEAFPRVLRRDPLKVEKNIHGAHRVVVDEEKKAEEKAKQEAKYKKDYNL